jgi:hypothetical protein
MWFVDAKFAARCHRAANSSIFVGLDRSTFPAPWKQCHVFDVLVLPPRAKHKIFIRGPMLL